VLGDLTAGDHPDRAHARTLISKHSSAGISDDDAAQAFEGRNAELPLLLDQRLEERGVFQ
jgi:hypothetical protein